MMTPTPERDEPPASLSGSAADDPLPLPAELRGRVLDLVATARTSGQRRILGLTGAPGAGKSTLAESLTAFLAGEAVYVPMDGFHLANAELVRLERRDRKGAPDTFDAAGYAALLARLRSPRARIVYAPNFDRNLEEPVAGSIPVDPDTPLVVTEGNYLLVDGGAWPDVRAQLDEVWYVEVPEELRLRRLVHRHEEFGKEPAAAYAWATGTDQRNADVVAGTRGRADLLVGSR